jgi:hypothetical protein
VAGATAGDPVDGCYLVRNLDFGLLIFWLHLITFLITGKALALALG